MTPLTGQIVSRISFDYGVTFLTESGDELRVGNPFTFAINESEVGIEPEDLSADAGTLLQLLHQPVGEVTIADSGTLTVTWESGARIRVEPDNDFEAWTMTSSTGAIHVCGPGGAVTTWSGK